MKIISVLLASVITLNAVGIPARAVISEAGYSCYPSGSIGEINAKMKKGGIYLRRFHKKPKDTEHSFTDNQL